MKKIFITSPVTIVLLLMVCTSCKSQVNPDTNYAAHERLSKVRYEEMQNLLTQYARDSNKTQSEHLSTRLETQIKLEEYLIKFREADHAKTVMWTPIYISIASALLSILSFIYSIRIKRKEK